VEDLEVVAEVVVGVAVVVVEAVVDFLEEKEAVAVEEAVEAFFHGLVVMMGMILLQIQQILMDLKYLNNKKGMDYILL
jgi:hypothetical protein